MRKSTCVWMAALGLMAAMASFTASACDRPITVGAAQVGASGTYPGSSPANAIDGNTGTAWNSGGFPTQWIQIDLGRVRPVCSLRLTALQSPAGTATHTVLIGDNELSLTPLRTVSRSFADFQVEIVPVAVNTRYIRIRTDSSPSWVAWREIQVFSSQSARANNADLRHYGYFGEGGIDDQPDPTPTVSDPRPYNVTAAVAAHSNVAWTRVWQVDNKIAQLNALGRSDTKLIVDMYDIFFDPSTPHATAWANAGMDALLDRHGSRMAAIVIMDEPDVHTDQELIGFDQKLDFLKQRIAARGRSIPVFIDYSYLAFTTNRWPGFARADWVGFNCYPQQHGSSGPFRYDQCTSNGAGGYHRISGHLNTIIAKTSANQRVAMFPQAFYMLPVGTQATTGTFVPLDAKDFMNAAYDNMLLLAENEPKVVALFNFYHQSLNTSAESWIGAEWLTDTQASRNIRAKLQSIGGCLTGRATCPARRLRPTNAGASAGASTVGYAFDDNPGTAWQAGGFPAQTIWYEFPRSVGIGRIRLIPSQAPVCADTTHEIWGGTGVGDLSRMAVHTGNTCDNQAFEIDEFWRNNDIRRIEIRTLSSPSWVSWREIEVYR